ncbi:MAG TPA: DUF5666 domain-containing protein [Candidatus Saccharimonadales bacterium]|nr:DUF5666 domain-containing protein [Candidatus Saccharimonadales bacterium]
MKHKIFKVSIYIILFMLFSVSAVGVVKAASATPSPTSTTSTLEQQINSLKDRIASRVAQLKLVDKRAILGKVTDVSETQLTVTDTHNNTRFVDVDELTNFSSPSASSTFGISDITKGSTVGVIGLYNKDSQRLLARWVDVQQNPEFFNGAILSIDNANYEFTVVTLTTTITAEVEDFTKTTSYDSTNGLTKSGYSKLAQGQRVTVVGYPDTKDPSKLIAERIIVFPNLLANPKISLVNPKDIAPITPSTGSGKKLTPIVK